MRHVLHFFKTKRSWSKVDEGKFLYRSTFNVLLPTFISKTNERRNMWPVGGKGLLVKVAYPLRKKNP